MTMVAKRTVGDPGQPGGGGGGGGQKKGTECSGEPGLAVSTTGNERTTVEILCSTVIYAKPYQDLLGLCCQSLKL